MKRFLQEPLLHFLLLGAAIFVAYGMVSKRSNVELGKIVITQGQVEHLTAGFAKTWQRPPTPDELAGLILDRVREEIYYREAMALGLDRDDSVIRRRLRQKMEFVSDNIAAQVEPGDEDLNAYLQAHPDKFRVEQRFTFQQIFLNPQKHGDKLAQAVTQMLGQLIQAGNKADAAKLGDATLLEPTFKNVPIGEVAQQFGEEFATELSGVPPGQWQGPVKSGYGLHLVFVSERTEGHLPSLADVRGAVRREWDNDRRLEANEAFYQELLKRYTVTVEEPQPASTENNVAKAS